ncbi:sugar ABC transporter permease [Spirochaetia bacterium]|nr:sugar ABC transporter permease [Spirochaetia bacterium]
MNAALTRKKSFNQMAIIFVLPALLIYLGLFIYPSVQAFYISLFDWNGFTSTMKFVGLSNFREILGDKTFWSVAVWNSLRITVLGGVFIVLLAFLLSGILTSPKLRGKKVFRALIFFPSVVNPIAISIFWNFIYNHNQGLLNGFLSLIGLKGLQQMWMDPSHLFYSILAALVWLNTGFYCVILLAALDRVPVTYIEAARLEGAGEFKIFFKIKLPLIIDVFSTALTLWAINSIKEFALLYSWGGGIDIPAQGATNMAVKMYVTAFGKRVTVFRMGYSTTMGIVMFLMVALFVGIIALAFRRRDRLEY